MPRELTLLIVSACSPDAEANLAFAEGALGALEDDMALRCSDMLPGDMVRWRCDECLRSSTSFI